MKPSSLSFMTTSSERFEESDQYAPPPRIPVLRAHRCIVTCSSFSATS